QLLYRRLIMFHFLQLTAVMMLLVVVHQVLQFWAVALVSENRTPVAIWEPALVSGLVWPRLYALLHVSMRQLHLARLYWRHPHQDGGNCCNKSAYRSVFRCRPWMKPRGRQNCPLLTWPAWRWKKPVRCPH